MIRIALLAACTLLMIGCGSAPTRLNAVPDADTFRAQIPGMPGVRHFLPEGAKEFEAEARLSLTTELKLRERAAVTTARTARASCAAGPPRATGPNSSW